MSEQRATHRLEVDLDRLQSNAREVVRLAGARRVLAVVKADAYGHGAPETARAFLDGGVHGLTVFLVEEGLELRAAAVDAPILVMGPLLPEVLGQALDADLVPTAHSTPALQGLAEESRRRAAPLRFQLKVDTGMGRLGVPLAELGSVLESLARYTDLEMTGLMSHLACADDPDHPLNALQRDRFRDALAAVRDAGHRPDQVHLANSSWLLRAEKDAGNAVRPGLALYGLPPAPGIGDPGLRPALRYRTRIVQLKEIPEGGPVGYDATWSAPAPRQIATLPLGYAEGIPRNLDRGGEVLVAGHRAPIVGRISMDLTAIDVTGIPGVRLGTRTTLLGSEGGHSIDASDWSRLTGTIPWEILCGIPARIQRVHVRGASGNGEPAG